MLVIQYLLGETFNLVGGMCSKMFFRDYVVVRLSVFALQQEARKGIQN